MFCYTAANYTVFEICDRDSFCRRDGVNPHTMTADEIYRIAGDSLTWGAWEAVDDSRVSDEEIERAVLWAIAYAVDHVDMLEGLFCDDAEKMAIIGDDVMVAYYDAFEAIAEIVADAAPID